MMAGLSLRNVITAPSDAMPGKLNSGLIKGRSSFSSRSTTWNSTNSLPTAPVTTQMLIKKKHVLSNKSWAVCMIVLSMLAAPIFQPM